MIIVVGADHGGFLLKEAVRQWLTAQGHIVLDVGAFSEESVDYPDFACKAAREILSGRAEMGMLFCGTGIGISIAANKIRGIRAACVWNPEVAALSKRHNNANVITMGGRVLSAEEGIAIAAAWLGATFEKGRHDVRIGKITAIEDGTTACN